MRIISIILILSIFLTSCTTVHYINEENFDTMKAVLTQKSMSDKAYLNSDFDSGLNIRIVKLDLDSITYINENLETKTKSLSNVIDINFNDKGDGARKGAIYGFGVGVVFAILLSLPEEDSRTSIAAGIGGGLSYSLFGLLGGTILGNKESYVFNKKEFNKSDFEDDF